MLVIENYLDKVDKTNNDYKFIQELLLKDISTELS